MADEDEPWLKDPIIKPADAPTPLPPPSSTPVQGLPDFPGFGDLKYTVPQGQQQTPAQPQASADDQPWLKDPIIQPAPQPQAKPDPYDQTGVAQPIDYDAIHAQRDANTNEWRAKRNLIGADTDTTAQEKAAQFVAANEPSGLTVPKNPDWTGPKYDAQAPASGSNVGSDIGVGIRHAEMAALGTIARAGSKIDDLFGSEEGAKTGKDIADETNRQSSAEEAGLQENEKQLSPAGQFVHKRFRGIVSAATTAFAAGPAALAVFGAEAANSSMTEADDAGLTGWKKTAYVGTNTAIATVTGWLASKLLGGGGAGGAEQAIPAQTLKEAITQGAKDFAIGGAKETPTFFAMNILSKLNQKVAGIDKTDWKWGDLTDALADSTFDAFGFQALGTGKSAIDKFIESPSRNNARNAGITIPVDQEAREQIAQQLQESKQGPEAPPQKREPLQSFEDQETDRLKKVGLTDDQIAETKKSGLFAKDNITGFTDARAGIARQDTLKRAIELTGKNHEPATYADLDVKNLGGLNEHAGYQEANKVFKMKADVVKKALAEALPDADVHLFRHGGDEMSAVVSNASNEDVQAALNKAKDSLEKWAKETKVPGKDYTYAELPKKGSTKPHGTGIHFGTSELRPGIDIQDAIGNAEAQTQARKLGLESYDVPSKLSGEKQSDASLGQSGSAAGSLPADTAGVSEKAGVATRPDARSGEAPEAGRAQSAEDSNGGQPHQQEPVPAGEGRTEASANSAADQAAPQQPAAPAEGVTRADLEKLSDAEIRKRLADDFGVKSKGKRPIESYLDEQAKANGGLGEMSMGAAFGPIDISGEGIKDIGSAFLRTLKHVRDVVQGESLPRVTKMDRRTGELLAEHASSSIAAKPTAEALYSKVFGNDAKLANKTMAVLTEDNLRGIQDQHNAAQNGQTVHSLVGPNGTWKTEAEYQRDAHSPEIQAAIQKWKDVVNPWMDKQYATSKGLSGTANLPSRGREFDARINLLANDHVPNKSGPVSGGGSPDNARKNFNAFRKKATGAAENGYSTDAQAVMENTVNTVISKATRLRAIDSMVEKGVAQYGVKGQPPPAEIKGEPVAHFPVEIPTSTGMEKKEMYFPKSIEGEVRQALNTDVRGEPNGIIKAVNAFQMLGITDATSHSANIIRGIMQAPGGSGVLQELTQRGIPGVKLVDTVARIASKAIDVSRGSPETQERVANLARIGALRPEHEGGGKTAQALGAMDKAGRLVMDELFDTLVKRGLKTDTDTNRREFVNQLGQYNQRLQPKWMAMMKDWGVSPFIVAGTTYNRMGAKALIGGHGGEATSLGAEAQLRSTQIMRNMIIPAAAAAAMTYLITGKPMSKGVPLGAVDTGKKDDKGNPIYVDLLDVTRRGMNVTGTGKVMDGMISGREPGMIADSAARDIVNNNLHPFAGPGAKAGVEAVTGQKFGIGLGPTGPAAPVGQSQALQNVKNAGKEINPLLGGIASPGDGKSRPDAIKDAGTSAMKTLLGIKTGTQPLSPAAELAQAYYRRQIGDKQYDEESQKAHDIKKQLELDVHKGMSKQDAIKKAVDTGLVTEKEALASFKSGELDRGDSVFKKLKPEDAAEVLKKASPEERASWKGMMDQKIANLMKPLGSTIPVDSGKKEEWKANVNSAIERAQKMGLTKEQVREAYVKSLAKLKSDDTRQADIQKFNVQLNYRWKERAATAQ